MAQDHPFFHLPMDEISYHSDDKKSYVANVGKLGQDAIVHGNPQTILDPQMGSCMLFDGVNDFIELTDLTAFTFDKGMTVAAWVRYDELNNGSNVFDLSTSTQDEGHFITLVYDDKADALKFYAKRRQVRAIQGITLGVWQHFFVRVDITGMIELYINGSVIDSIGLEKYSISNLDWIIGYIGKSNGQNDALFKGAMAHFRLYNQPLSETELRNIMEQDQNSMAHYRETAQLKLDLYTIRDDDHKPILYIESGNKSEPLELALTNPHQKTVAFKPASTPKPTEEDFHIQLRFRCHVMSENVFSKLKRKDMQIDGWEYKAGISSDKRSEFISFIKKDSNLELKKAATQLITLPEFSATARGGARNTRIEVRFNTEEQGLGSVVRHMEIQSHLGLKTIPLTARIKGSNTILNDGNTPNELIVEIRNPHAKAISFAKGSDNSSRFELIIDTDVISTWTDTPANKTKGLPRIKVKDPDNDSAEEKEANFVIFAEPINDLEPPLKLEGEHHIAFQFNVSHNQLEAGQSLTLKINNWFTNAPTGTYNILLRHENIPGYWDSGWTLPVMLNPLGMRNGNVSIGTTSTQEKLNLKGNMQMHGQLLIGEPKKVENAKSEFNKEYSGANDQNDPGIIFASEYGNDDYAWIRYHSRSGGAHNLEVQVNQKGADHLALNPKGGNVGIGIESPEAELHVNGRIQDKSGELMPVGAIIAFGGDTPPKGWLKCNGMQIPDGAEYDDLRARIGTNTPPLEDKFVLGKGASTEPSGGNQTVTLTINEMPNHTHDINDPGHVHKFEDFRHSSTDRDDSSLPIYASDINDGNKINPVDSAKTGITVKSSGGGRSFEIMPPYFALIYIIKY